VNAQPPPARGRSHHLRAGDADRDRTLEALQQHMAAGRLTAEEFHERAGAALAARTLGDLDALLADLPPLADPLPVPAHPPAEPSRRRGLLRGWRP
jgi:hypothetical protein